MCEFHISSSSFFSKQLNATHLLFITTLARPLTLMMCVQACEVLFHALLQGQMGSFEAPAAGEQALISPDHRCSCPRQIPQCLILLPPPIGNFLREKQ